MWQMGGLGPMLGQTHHFLRFNKGVSDYAENRFHTEASRLYGVLNTQLEGRDFITGAYSVADIAVWPWISRFEWQEIDLNAFPNVRDWYLRIADRPAVQRGYQVPKNMGDIPMP
jgi:GST-like protein